MNSMPPVDSNVATEAIAYEPPELVSVGAASAVILGMSGGGFDGAYGMTWKEFEFEPDDLD
jgi:hypothetical protein